MSDQRTEILEWLDDAVVLASPSCGALAVRALRAEVEAHEPVMVTDGWICNDCSVLLEPDACCGAIQRIHAATVGAS